MAKKRFVETAFRTDPYIQDLNPSEKLLYLYCFTNNSSDLCGIYEISIRTISFDTGFEKEMILKIINRFAKDHKIYYINGRIYVKNFTKHQSNNPSIQKGIERSLESVPNEILEETKRLSKLSQSGQTGYRLGTDCDSVYTESALPTPTPTPTPTLNNIDQNGEKDSDDISFPKQKKKGGDDFFSPQEQKDMFDEFRELYAHKKDREDCFKKFVKFLNDGVKFEDIMDGLRKYNSEQKIEIWRKKRLPSTWLNKKARENDYNTGPTFENKQEEFNYLYNKEGRDATRKMFGVEYDRLYQNKQKLDFLSSKQK